MLNLTTFEIIGERYNLPDDIIDKMTGFYLKDCYSHNNIMTYYTQRYYFYDESPARMLGSQIYKIKSN